MTRRRCRAPAKGLQSLPQRWRKRYRTLRFAESLDAIDWVEKADGRQSAFL
jgi:hypothetical protein